MVIAFRVPVTQITADDWKLVAAAGIAAVLKAIYNYLDPGYTGYGRVKKEVDNNAN